MEHLYLDAASTEPVGGNVISVMMPFLTEADNLAIKGIAMARIRLLCEAYGEQVRPRVIVSSIEHPAVLESVRWMERWFGCEVVEIPVDHQVHIGGTAATFPSACRAVDERRWAGTLPTIRHAECRRCGRIGRCVA